MRFLLPALLCLVFSSLVPSSAFAAAKTDTPLTRLNAKTDEMMKGLNEDQTLQFQKIRTAHGTIRAVNDVRRSLDRAVKSCSKANPDLSNSMTAQAQDWKNAVLPVMRQGENRLEKMILSQDFARPSAVRAYLKMFDDAVTEQDRQIKEVPISRAEDCKALMDNLDKSQKTMGKLIIETLGLDQDSASLTP